MAWDERMKDFRARRDRARGMGGPERLARRQAEGKLNARERIDRLLEAGSFLEVGTFNVSDVPADAERTPADSKVAGLGTIGGRPVIVCSNDFTVMAATSSRVASHKEAELKMLAVRRGLPIVYFSEAGGARMPDIMGSAGIASFGNSTYYGERRRQVPMVTAVMGQSYGQAYFNMGGGGYADLLVAWPTADMSFMDPDTGVNVVHGAELAALPPEERAERRKELITRWEWDTLPYGAAGRHLIDEVIDPADTRDVILRFLEGWSARGRVGQHRLANWPTKL